VSLVQILSQTAEHGETALSGLVRDVIKQSQSNNMKKTLAIFILALAASSLTSAQISLPKPAADKALAQQRKRIDAIDKSIIKLLNERARIALEIGRVRQRANIPPASAQGRQEEVLRNVMAQSVLPLSPTAARRIYECIIAEMVELQRQDSEKGK
jgi:chorismate mutase